MSKFKLTNKAVEDLSNIWYYTFDTWSEKQADIYYESLILNCQVIADNSYLGINYDGITHDLLGMKVNRHIIFYRITNENYVEITRILHERMDLKKRITE
ncbi:type II toxin-antitoxin system RelE/ParE family toxin [Psychroserpens luteus]|uniref:Toxin n=1 Tax=Psychroserpens luteus TaxID=1434066 RepID=A0ABW5ZQK3_9FLAO|nr:type II toxin-antitoxin system RelE/ParE family toxin [Psychroserpens luteus]